MVTIEQTRDNQTTNLVIVNTTEDAEAFLDRLAGRYWGEPGFRATRIGTTLEIAAKVIGGQWRTSSLYTIKETA